MLTAFLALTLGNFTFVLGSLGIAAIGACLLYVILFYVLRSIFRQFERDIALVTLNVSAYPVLTIFILVSLKFAFRGLEFPEALEWIERLLTASLIVTVSYWIVQLFTQVIAYYLKEYAQQTEAMWDNVLIPLLEGVVPFVVCLLGGVLLLQCFGVDLTGIWVTLGGATFVIGFAVKDILANFFSGIVLLIDTPFQFGDVLRLDDGSLAMLRKIGIRVTQLYMFKDHCEVYIPNSVLQEQRLTNLSRPTPHYHYSIEIEFPPHCDLDLAQMLMREVVIGHPDTLGDIDHKLRCLDKFYRLDEAGNRTLSKGKKEAASLRLQADNEVNLKLEDIERSLEALMVTLQFAEKGGLTQDEIDNVQQEYLAVLDLIGLKVITTQQGKRAVCEFEEIQSLETLIGLIREWYRIWLKDPNLLDEDQYLLPQEWERKIELLKRRAQRLFLKILNPEREETRLDDYVIDLLKWLKEKFKQARNQQHEPHIWMAGTSQYEGFTFIKFTLNFYVDDVKLENCKRGERVCSEIYQEVMRHLKQSYNHQ
ncbi:MAG TPA: mechanosensitive ion channel protein MscS [Cyanobacteria bacterium UBA8803]|nr:mechanosensitive ion channel protein MscS [Cyanobacteria bacterium UBA9273]HBL62752.1 mechanosensitive ion channel protein MscS [Cyanobacteria bacterium UBA8803]